MLVIDFGKTSLTIFRPEGSTKEWKIVTASIHVYVDVLLINKESINLLICILFLVLNNQQDME